MKIWEVPTWDVKRTLEFLERAHPGSRTTEIYRMELKRREEFTVRMWLRRVVLSAFLPRCLEPIGTRPERTHYPLRWVNPYWWFRRPGDAVRAKGK